MGNQVGPKSSAILRIQWSTTDPWELTKGCSIYESMLDDPQRSWKIDIGKEMYKA